MSKHMDNTGNYKVGGITYDHNGNLLSLDRKGAINESATSFGNMDNLSYLYHPESNKLKAVNDSGHSVYGFKEGSSAQTHYTYDANGNLTPSIFSNG